MNSCRHLQTRVRMHQQLYCHVAHAPCPDLRLMAEISVQQPERVWRNGVRLRHKPSAVAHTPVCVMDLYGWVDPPAHRICCVSHASLCKQ